MVTCWLCFGTKRIGAVWISDEHVEDRSMRRSNACLPQITTWFSCKLHQVCQIFQKLTLSHLLEQGSNILCHQLCLQQVPVAVQKRRETTLWWGCCCWYNNCKLCQVISLQRWDLSSAFFLLCSGCLSSNLLLEYCTILLHKVFWNAIEQCKNFATRERSNTLERSGLASSTAFPRRSAMSAMFATPMSSTWRASLMQIPTSSSKLTPCSPLMLSLSQTIKPSSEQPRSSGPKEGFGNGKRGVISIRVSLTSPDWFTSTSALRGMTMPESTSSTTASIRCKLGLTSTTLPTSTPRIRTEVPTVIPCAIANSRTTSYFLVVAPRICFPFTQINVIASNIAPAITNIPTPPFHTLPRFPNPTNPLINGCMTSCCHKLLGTSNTCFKNPESSFSKLILVEDVEVAAAGAPEAECFESEVVEEEEGSLLLLLLLLLLHITFIFMKPPFCASSKPNFLPWLPLRACKPWMPAPPRNKKKLWKPQPPPPWKPCWMLVLKCSVFGNELVTTPTTIPLWIVRREETLELKSMTWSLSSSCSSTTDFWQQREINLLDCLSVSEAAWISRKYLTYQRFAWFLLHPDNNKRRLRIRFWTG